MNHYAICNRCNKLDKEQLGFYTLCTIRNTKIYVCFSCSDLCYSCKSNPENKIEFNTHLCYSCKKCYNVLHS